MNDDDYDDDMRIWVAFIMRTMVLSPITSRTKFSNSFDMTSVHIWCWNDWWSFGMWRSIGRALITNSMHCFWREREKHRTTTSSLVPG